jgi:hypothetical protein
VLGESSKEYGESSFDDRSATERTAGTGEPASNAGDASSAALLNRPAGRLKIMAGVLPVAMDLPRAGTSFRFVRPLVLNEETKVTFNYRSK